jgi:hypothetical protein
MPPVLTPHDSANSGCPNAKVLSQTEVRDVPLGIQSSDFQYLRLAQFYAPIMSPAVIPNSDPPFSLTVFPILQRRPQKQVVWVNTTGVIARMASVESVWDRPMGQLPGHTMCASAISMPTTDIPISFPIFSPFPQPTPCRAALFIYLGPKSCFKRCMVTALSATPPITKPPPPILDVRRPCKKSVAAPPAYPFDFWHTPPLQKATSKRGRFLTEGNSALPLGGHKREIRPGTLSPQYIQYTPNEGCCQ